MPIKIDKVMLNLPTFKHIVLQQQQPRYALTTLSQRPEAFPTSYSNSVKLASLAISGPILRKNDCGGKM